jgi:hypothetical protein
MMRKQALAVAALVALVAAAAPALAGTATGRTFTTALTGAAEAPGPGDPDATGTASLVIHPGQGTVCYDLSWADVGADPAAETVFAAHIHRAPAGSPGPVVITLFTGESFSGTDSDSGCVTAPSSLLGAILGNPEGYYVNVHSNTFPGGAVRGQLGR